MDNMSVVKEISKVKIYYSSFFKQFIVLFPKGDGHSQMDRFSALDEAEESIRARKEEEQGRFWWMSDNET